MWSVPIYIKIRSGRFEKKGALASIRIMVLLMLLWQLKQHSKAV